MDALTTTISPLVIDIILAAVILTFACLKAKAGLYHSVMSIVVIIVAIAVGLVGSKLLLDPVVEYAWGRYSVQVEEEFDDTVEKALSGEKSLSTSFQESWNRVVDSFESEKLDELRIEKGEVDYTDSELVAKLKALTLMKARMVCEKVCHLALFAVCTAVAILLFTLLKNLLENVANFSIIGWVNHAGGFVLGLVEILVIMILVGRVGTMLNIQALDDIRQGTVLLNWLCGGDLQSSITAVQNLTLEDVKNIKLEDLTTVDFKDVEQQVKGIVNNIDLSGAPEEVTDVLNKIDTDALKEEAEGVKDAVEDSVDKAKEKKAEKDKEKEESKGLGGKILDGITDTVKDTVKDAVEDTVKDSVNDAVKDAVKDKVAQ